MLTKTTYIIQILDTKSGEFKKSVKEEYPRLYIARHAAMKYISNNLSTQALISIPGKGLTGMLVRYYDRHVGLYEPAYAWIDYKSNKVYRIHKDGSTRGQIRGNTGEFFKR